MKLPELSKPLFVLEAQLLVDIFNVLVRKFFQDVPLFVCLCFNQLYLFLRSCHLIRVLAGSA